MNGNPTEKNPLAPRGPLEYLIRFCLDNTLVVSLITLMIIAWGILVAPFDWRIPGIERDPVPVDAIPDIGENQQIVFTDWMGRSPQDVEDQITYPLTVQLLGIADVKSVRSLSMFGFSTIYLIFEESARYERTRTSILEKLSSLPPGTLPEDARPALGPDATALGQIFWYTLEGRDESGNPAGGWDPQELRTIQDWYVRYALQAAEGVAEVASIGGFEKEYQIDVDPDAMRAYGVSLGEVMEAVRASNIDVGARTIEINQVENVIRGLGFLRGVEDIEKSVIMQVDDVPITIDRIARVTEGPALRTGALDKGGAEAVGGVAVARYGANPLKVIQNVKEKIAEVSPGLPRKTLEDGTVSQVTIVPFYDRTGLIHETLGTLNSAIRDQILITIIVVLFMVMNLRSSMLIAGLLPLAVLLAFIGMKYTGVDANIVALSGIAIAIGTVVDMGIVLCENMLEHLEAADPDEPVPDVLFRATREVGSAVMTAVATTVISFLPVFAMEGAEGKLFKPLAFTKTYVLVASIVVALTLLPSIARLLFLRRGKRTPAVWTRAIAGALAAAGVAIGLFVHGLGYVAAAVAAWQLAKSFVPERWSRRMQRLANVLVALAVAWILSWTWEPLGVGAGAVRNLAFVVLVVGALLLGFLGFLRIYERMLRICLRYKMAFLTAPALIVLFGAMVWLGFERTLGWLPAGLRESAAGRQLASAFPGLGKEFMPSLDEGSYLYMPVTMPHASIGEAMDVLAAMDEAINAIPEVEQAVGKIGRVESALDPAPVSMIETVINYMPEYRSDPSGRRLRFRYDDAGQAFVRDAQGQLIEDPRGKPYRQWRDHIRTPDDIWDEIVKAARLPGVTSAPKLQPIAARIVMLQSGMRAPMGVKVKGPTLEAIEEAGYRIEAILKEVEGVQPAAVIADRIVGVPYLEIDIDRDRIARYGIRIQDVQEVIEVAIGGIPITRTVEGRERYGVRIRYLRELRDSIEMLGRILVPAPAMPGMAPRQIPLEQLAEIRFTRGPMSIRSEDTFLVGYVLFDRLPGYAEVNVVENAQAALRNQLDDHLPSGVSYSFAGTWENQLRAQAKLRVVLPLALFLIFLIIYLQFRSTVTALLIFSAVFVAWSGGFVMLWLYGQEWFLDVNVFGESLRQLFNIRPYNLSVAVWVGFLALFGIATDDGVIISTYIGQRFRENRPATVEAIRESIVEAGKRRIRPCLMTSATTILALLPVLTSTGRGSDIMVPMAIPSFGGMTIVLVTLFVVPVLYALVEEVKLNVMKKE